MGLFVQHRGPFGALMGGQGEMTRGLSLEARSGAHMGRSDGFSTSKRDEVTKMNLTEKIKMLASPAFLMLLSQLKEYRNPEKILAIKHV